LVRKGYESWRKESVNYQFPERSMFGAGKKGSAEVGFSFIGVMLNLVSDISR
jgi:hypothetical protein